VNPLSGFRSLKFFDIPCLAALQHRASRTPAVAAALPACHVLILHPSMKRNDGKTAQMSFHLYIEDINDELKSYLPYISTLVHSSKAVLLPSGATQQHY
jgi:hypothetical protein